MEVPSTYSTPKLIGEKCVPGPTEKYPGNRKRSPAEVWYVSAESLSLNDD